MVEERITLPQAQLALLDRQKTFLCANNLSGCVKNRQRGCIVACVDAQRIVAHCSSDSTGSVSRPCSRATAPSRPFTTDSLICAVFLGQLHSLIDDNTGLTLVAIQHLSQSQTQDSQADTGSAP